jgi:hypothetical protein
MDSITPEYIVTAFSPSMNTRQRELNLMGPAPTTAKNAQQWADAFATRCNKNKLLGAEDWRGEIEQVDKSYYARTQ